MIFFRPRRYIFHSLKAIRFFHFKMSRPTYIKINVLLHHFAYCYRHLFTEILINEPQRGPGLWYWTIFADSQGAGVSVITQYYLSLKR